MPPAPTLLFPADTPTASAVTPPSTRVTDIPTETISSVTSPTSLPATLQRDATAEIRTPEPGSLSSPTPSGDTPYPLPDQAGGASTATPAGPYPYPFPQSEAAISTVTPIGAYPYPAPLQQAPVIVTPTFDSAYPQPQQPGLSSPTSLATAPVPSLTAGSQQVTPTGPPPTERFPQPFGLQVTPAAGKVSIFHSWGSKELPVLLQVIDSFQDYFPNVVFDLTYIPKADLLDRFTQNAYYGGGPDLLFGASAWRGTLTRQNLVENLAPYISASFRNTFNPAALKTGEYQGTQACLPYSLDGAVPYRNKQIISQAPASFSQLVSSARLATKAGVLGAYFEGGSYFSLAHLLGLGGQLMDPGGLPLFDQNQYKVALEWMGLLREMKRLGAVELNGDRDRLAFEQGKAGWIVEGTWNRQSLAQAIGPDNLAIDPWPAYASGRLSGFVQSECIYVNINTGELSALDHEAALNFIGYMMTPSVQVRLAELGMIPSLIQAQPSDPLIRQAMLAFQGGSPFPSELDEALRQVYFTALDKAVDNVINQGQDPLLALQTAFASIQKRVVEIKGGAP